MARDKELRKRVQRLLDGDVRPFDFAHLFLWLRERSYGVWSIKELGDFVAHSDTKTKGFVTDEMRDFFRYLDLRMSRRNDPGKKPLFLLPDLNDLPADFDTIVRERLRHVESATIRQKTGLHRRVAEAALKSALSKFETNASGRRYRKGVLTKDEAATLICCLNEFIPKPMFTQQGLWRDFCFVLVKNKLLEESERKALKPIERGLILFALSMMHLSEIPLSGTHMATINAGIHLKTKKLTASVLGTWTVAVNGGLGYANIPLLETDLSFDDCCDPALKYNARGEFTSSIELSPSLRLDPL